jgi:hypothetical protein
MSNLCMMVLEDLGSLRLMYSSKLLMLILVRHTQDKSMMPW